MALLCSGADFPSGVPLALHNVLAETEAWDRHTRSRAAGASHDAFSMDAAHGQGKADSTIRVAKYAYPLVVPDQEGDKRKFMYLYVGILLKNLRAIV